MDAYGKIKAKKFLIGYLSLKKWPSNSGTLFIIKIISKNYDKRDDFDSHIEYFPFLFGDLSGRASYGVYISQLIKFDGVCNHAADFNEQNKCLTEKSVKSKRDDFDFDLVNFPFLDGDVPRASYGVYISQLIRFARVCNHVTDFNARNKCLTAKLLQQGYRYHKLRKTFSKFYRRHYELISKYNVGLKTLLSEGLSEPEFYGDLVYKFKKLIGINDFLFSSEKS